MAGHCVHEMLMSFARISRYGFAIDCVSYCDPTLEEPNSKCMYTNQFDSTTLYIIVVVIERAREKF